MTKRFNKREKIVANEYNRAINEKINNELPKQLKIRFTHYDVKAKKKEERNFPQGLFALAKDAISKIKFFSVESFSTSRSKI